MERAADQDVDSVVLALIIEHAVAIRKGAKGPVPPWQLDTAVIPAQKASDGVCLGYVWDIYKRHSIPIVLVVRTLGYQPHLPSSLFQIRPCAFILA